MTEEEIFSNIKAVVNTLNCISVSGRNNLVNLGGCIQVLEDILKAIVQSNQNTTMEES